MTQFAPFLDCFENPGPHHYILNRFLTTVSPDFQTTRKSTSMEPQKVLLMGRSAAGKSSMKSVIFEKFSPDVTKKFKATVDVHKQSVNFLNLKLWLWDCGGQTLYMDGYADGSKPFMFSDVQAMVYVFDVENVDHDLDLDYHYYMLCLTALRKHSPSAIVFCLVHKMDLLQPDQRQSAFESRQADLLRMSAPTRCRCYMSSIYQNSLYYAWSAVVHELVPNIREMKRSLLKFALTMECEEVLLVERATFLVVYRYRRNETGTDPADSQRAAQVLRRFQRTCKDPVQFSTIVVKNSNFTIVADVLTPFTLILVVVKNGTTLEGAIIHNIKKAREHFTKFEKNQK